jgi:hypothetical protein
MPIAVERRVGTFLSIEEFPYVERRRTRGKANALAEITVDYSVPDIADLVVRVERRATSGPATVVWSR